MRYLLISLGAALAVAGPCAQATDGFYVGAGIGKSDLGHVEGSHFDLDSRDASWKVIAGFRPIAPFSVELNYMDFGRESREFGIGTARADAKAFGAYGVGYLPLLPLVELFGKAGLARWQLNGDFTGNGQLFSFDDRGTQFAYGAGWQANYGALAARFEYDGFQVRHSDGLSMYSLGVVWTFL